MKYFFLSKIRNLLGINREKLDFQSIPPDIKNDVTFMNIFRKSRQIALIDVERQFAIYQAIKYLANYKIRGDIVECGVYKGGSALVAAMTLMKLKEFERKVILYDTFQGMPKPTKEDVDFKGDKAIYIWGRLQEGKFSSWTKASIDEVKKNLKQSKYPESKIRFIPGKVEETIPKMIPNKIAYLHLDTDWFESTKHELKYLYPKLVKGGVLIVDDYGHFAGAKKAVDEYFKKIPNSKVYLHRTDYTSRMIIKP